MTPIQLDRQFSILSDGPIDDENSYLLSVRPALGWAELLARPRVVILAAAGSGKTTELEATVGQLIQGGKSAFFIRLNELAELTLERICRRGSVSLAAWKNDTTPGWFFLDARDELVLTGREFSRALEHLEEGLGDSAARARILISSRPTDWKVLADRKDFERVLPAPALDANDDVAGAHAGPRDDVDESDAVADTRKDSIRNAVMEVQMRPLDEGRILRLATHLGVTDTDAFKTKLHDLDAMPLAGRPGDLIGIANLWKDHRDIRNYEEILKSTIKSSLTDLRKIPGTRVELSVAEYHIGANRLAATMTLARGTAFQYADAESREQQRSVIRPDGAFTDWPPSQLDAVLRTNVFEPLSLGSVYFHNRSVKEYLTAQWILSIRARSGLSRSELHDILFSDIYGESILVPSMGPIAAWVAIQDEYVRSELLSRSPETFLEYGDPEQLTKQVKIELLRSVISATLQKGSRLFGQDSRTLRALANPVMTGTIRALWEFSSKRSSSRLQRYRDDARLLLLRLIQIGEMKDLAPIVFECATTRTNAWVTTVFAVRAMIALGKPTNISKFVSYLMKNGRRLDRQLVLGVVQDLYPEYLDASRALCLIDLHEKPAASVDIEPGYALRQMVERTKNELQRLELLRELTTRWARLGPDSYSEPYEYPEKSATRWIVPTILKLAHTILTESRQTSFADEQILAIAGAIRHAEDRDHRKEAIETRKSLFDRVSRRKIFWILLDNFKDWHPRSAIEWTLPMKVNILTSWIDLQDVDLQSLLEITQKTRKEAAFRAALTIWRDKDRSAKTKARIAKAAGNDKALQEIVNQYTRPKESPELRKSREQNRRIVARQRMQKEQGEKSWVRFKRSLKRNPQLLTDKSASKTNARLNALFNLYTRMTQKRSEERNIHATSNWKDLIPEYGEVVAKAAAEGFKGYWRTYASKLPSALQGIERNQTPYKTLVSLSGLAIEAMDGDAWMEKLSAAEVELAVGHAFREMNGFPSWLSRLAARYPDIVTALVETEVLFELDDPDQSMHPSILSRLPRHGAEKWPRLVDRLLRALRTAKAANSRAFGYAVDVLIGAGRVVGSEAAELYRTKLSLPRESEEHKIGYLAAWFALNADEATDALYAMIRGKSLKNRDRIVEEVFARLAGEARRNPIQFSSKDRVRTLERLVGLAYRHIRQGEDIQHDGVYSPGRRDKAESGREYVVKLLTDTPGQDTHRALIRLAQRPHMKSIAEGLRRRALERAQSDSEVPWKPAEVLQYEQDKARAPQSAADLFALVQRRLREIKQDLENGDFSQKALLKLFGTREEHYQIWLGGQLELRARGFYTAVREPEVIHRKKPDIVVYRTQIDARVPIEVKVVDKLSGMAVIKAFKKQLISQYQRDRKATHGILLLIGLNESKSWSLNGHHIRGIEDLGNAIRELGLKDSEVRRKGIRADVVTLRLWDSSSLN